MDITQRFINYTKFDTQSSEESQSVLSTSKQLIFAEYLKKELMDEGLEDVEMDENGVLTNCSADPNALQYSGELVGIHKLTNNFYRTMCREYAAIVDQKPKLGYEYELLDVSQRIQPMKVLCLEGLQWYEIDDEEDLRFAEANVRIS